jgi:two-component system, chemotaxis family, protein-glutamate methylesterase/glutaminase
MTVRALIIDDTTLFRGIVADVLSSCPDVTVVGAAPSGETALKILERREADLVLCDMHMPGLNGVETLAEIRKRFPQTIVVMMSGISDRSAEDTIKALENGALDFIQKPAGKSAQESAAQLKADLELVLRLVHTRLATAKIRTGTTLRRPVVPPPLPAQPAPAAHAVPLTFGIVAIGVSTGGPEALNKFIPHLPASLDVPVVLVQHMPAGFTRSLAESLARKSAVGVEEARDGQVLNPGTVYVAAGGRHMVVRRNERQLCIGINDEPLVNSCRPSVDVLFRSVAAVCEDRGVLAVVLTGMGSDGLEGLRALKRRRCYCITQDASSCVVYGMPRAVDEAGLSDLSLPIENVAAEICRKLGCRQ